MIRNAIQRGASDAELEQWKANFASAPFQLEITEGGVADSMKVAIPRAINLREMLCNKARAIGRDSLQRVFEVIRTMKMLEESGAKPTNESVAQWYVDKIRLSSYVEAVTRTFVEVALMVLKLVLKALENLKALRDSAERWGTNAALSSVYQLQVVVTKTEKGVCNDILVHCEGQ